MTPFCAAIDWGTSRFRLWLMAEDGSVLESISTNEGLQHSAKIGFSKILEHHLDALGAPSGLPVIICGMAGSRSGWKEAGYLRIPVDLHDVIGSSVRIDDPNRDIRILPGIAQFDEDNPDVMRGEETQLYGMLFDNIAPTATDETTICMPGTHSKWVTLSGNTIQRFSTFMTGEMFALLSAQSVLTLSLENKSKVDPQNPVFVKCLRNALERPQEIASQLFSIRSAHLLGFGDPANGSAALSGSLIGLELAGAFSKHGKPQHVCLMASGTLGDLYSVALADCTIETSLHNAELAGRVGMYQAATALWCTDINAKSRKA